MKQEFEEKEVRSFNEALNLCMELREQKYWSFRGQRNEEWPAAPHPQNINLYSLYKDFDNFKARCMEFPRPDYIEDTSNPIIKEWRWLFYAQHHRLKTMLLDWTSNPLVALYFAVENTLSRSGNSKNTYGAIWALHVKNEEKFKWENDLKMEPKKTEEWLLIRPPVVTHRIARQSGLFTFHPISHFKSPESFCCNDDDKEIIKIRIVQQKDKSNPSDDIRRKLGFMNIHHASLFPHPDGVANFINQELPELKPLEEMDSYKNLISNKEILKNIVGSFSRTSIFPKEFFISWSGVPTLAYIGFSATILKIKDKLDKSISGISNENEGSKWPKTTLGALKDGKILSKENLYLLRDICDESNKELQDKCDLAIAVETIHGVVYQCRSLERSIEKLPLLLQDSPPEMDEPPQWHLTDVDKVLEQFSRDKLDAYINNVHRDGNRESDYRNQNIGTTLVFYLPSKHQIHRCINNFIKQVNQSLPDYYSWFDKESLHVTLRTLTTHSHLK